MLFFISQLVLEQLRSPGTPDNVPLSPEKAFMDGKKKAREVRLRLKEALAGAKETEIDELLFCKKLRDGILVAVAQVFEESGESRNFNLLTHHHDVAELAKKLGIKMGLSNYEIKVLECAALIHDFGKWLLNPDFSSEERKLNDDEYAVIRRHVELSLELLDGIIENKDIIRAVGCHHKNFDGTGYPNTVNRSEDEKENILADILQLCDAWNAMRGRKQNHGREVERPLTLEEAREELKKNKGTQFRPEAVDEFLDLDLAA